MYFDDGSRRGQQQWKPGKNAAFQVSPQTQPFAQSVEEEKLDAIQRMLIGYNAETASQLSEDEILEQMEVWADRSGVVGSYFGDELFEESLGTSVCNATTLVASVAQFWESMVQVIDASTDEFAPQRWTTTTSSSESAAKFRRQRQEGVVPEQVHFVVFPNCPDLYDYKTLFTLVMAMEFSKEKCLYLGTKFGLTLFHPHYKNSPKLWSPERHSPFPAAGLHFGDKTMRKLPPSKQPTVPKRQRGNAKSSATTKKVLKKKSSEDEEDEDENSEIVDRTIRDLDLQRAHLELLFNSAAASGSDGESIVSPRDFQASEDEACLSATFRQEQQSRRGLLPPAAVQELSQTWIAQNQFLDAAQRQPNQALQLAGTVADDAWVISSHKMAEKVYADIWKAISELYERGQAAERAQAETQQQTQQEAVEQQQEAPKSEPFDWMKTISQSFQPDRTKKAAIPQSSEILSTMFVATKFCAYNAPAFKRFAITVQAPLKRLTGGRMFLEVFHPEYVGKNGYSNVLRRSPFPMIQICYEIPTTTTAKAKDTSDKYR